MVQRGATRFPGRRDLFRSPHVGLRQFDLLFRASNLTFVPLRDSLVHTLTLHPGPGCRQGDAANGSLAGLRGDLRPTFDGSTLLLADSSRTVRLLTPQLLGAVAAAKVTSGNTAQITRDLKPAAPAAAKAVRNVEKITRPAGWLARIGSFVLKIIRPF